MYSKRPILTLQTRWQRIAWVQAQTLNRKRLHLTEAVLKTFEPDSHQIITLKTNFVKVKIANRKLGCFHKYFNKHRNYSFLKISSYNCKLFMKKNTTYFGYRLMLQDMLYDISMHNFPESRILAKLWLNDFSCCQQGNGLACFKVHIFWEGHKILQNLHLTFVLCSASQK